MPATVTIEMRANARSRTSAINIVKIGTLTALRPKPAGKVIIVSGVVRRDPELPAKKRPSSKPKPASTAGTPTRADCAKRKRLTSKSKLVIEEHFSFGPV